MVRHPRRYAVVVAVVVVLASAAIALVLRSTDPGPRQEPAAEAEPSPVPVIVPGRPGESAAAVPSDQIRAPDGSRYNAVDVWFTRMMIPHHQQALEMVELAPDRAAEPAVGALAERIGAAQEPEIAVLRSWLASRGLAETDDEHAQHSHEDMPGMQSPEAMQELAATSGDAFDRMFVDMMADHHQGAVDMANQVLTSGVDERLQELATNIAVEQSIEITRMRELVD